MEIFTKNSQRLAGTSFLDKKRTWSWPRLAPTKTQNSKQMPRAKKKVWVVSENRRVKSPQIIPLKNRGFPFLVPIHFGLSLFLETPMFGKFQKKTHIPQETKLPNFFRESFCCCCFFKVQIRYPFRTGWFL